MRLFVRMPKITINFVLVLLRLVMKSIEKVVALIISIIDLVDDGVINGSYSSPVWLDTVKKVLVILRNVCDQLDNVYDQVDDTDPVERSEDSLVGNA